jgi:hypothetical protein
LEKESGYSLAKTKVLELVAQMGNLSCEEEWEPTLLDERKATSMEWPLGEMREISLVKLKERLKDIALASSKVVG